MISFSQITVMHSFRLSAYSWYRFIKYLSVFESSKNPLKAFLVSGEIAAESIIPKPITTANIARGASVFNNNGSKKMFSHFMRSLMLSTSKRLTFEGIFLCRYFAPFGYLAVDFSRNLMSKSKNGIALVLFVSLFINVCTFCQCHVYHRYRNVLAYLSSRNRSNRFFHDWVSAGGIVHHLISRIS